MRNAVMFLLALLCGVQAHAQDGEPWKFQAAIYGYFPKVGGSTTFPPDGGGSPVNLDGSRILDHLQGAFMGSFAGQRGPWGFYTDAIYLDFSGSKSQSTALNIAGVLPVGASADVNFGLKGWLWTLAGTWRAQESPAAQVDVLAGARMLDIREHVSWGWSGNIGSIAVADRAGSRSTDARHWDAILGTRGRAALSADRKWFVPWYLDVGTGESKFTWQAMAGVGYAFGWGDVVGNWRYIDYHMKSGQALESLKFSGPSIGAVFHW